MSPVLAPSSHQFGREERKLRHQETHFDQNVISDQAIHDVPELRVRQLQFVTEFRDLFFAEESVSPRVTAAE